MELIVKADDKNLEKVLDFIHRQLPSYCETDLLYKIDLAAEEIFVNIAHYAYKEKVPQEEDENVWLECTFEDDTLCMIFSDKGVPFNPLDRPDPDITLSAEDRRIGGLGIFLIQEYSDTLSYEYADGENRLTIGKKLK